MKLIRSLAAAGLVTVAALGGSAHAALTAFQTYTGNYGVSSDGWGSASASSGIISASVPAGATIVAAYLYTSSNNNLAGAGGSLNGMAVTYSPLSSSGFPSAILQAARADVTSIVKPLIDNGIGSVGGVYNFNVSETNTMGQDGEALVVVYQLATLAVSTIGILDGSSNAMGDTTTVNFAQPVDPTAAGFAAELRLGIGFSFDGVGCSGGTQVSSVSVTSGGNSQTLTNSAGCNDDSVDANPAAGNLITVGGFDDPFSPLSPTIAADKERYNLASYIVSGSTSLQINTLNPSRDDNIFLGIVQVSGIAGINAPPPGIGVPEPMTVSLVALALAGLGAQRRRLTRR